MAIAQEALPQLYSAAEEAGFTVPSVGNQGWTDELRGLPVTKLHWYLEGRVIDVDLFMAETEFQKKVLERRQRHPFDSGLAWFISPEDLLLFKLMAFRPKDQSDIQDLLFVQGELDEQYLREWASKLQVENELREVLAKYGR